MSLTVQEIILDAQKLVIRISDHENTADHLISEIEAAYNQINNMKEYREEVEILNLEAGQRPRSQLIREIQKEIQDRKRIEAENGELRDALDEHRGVLELIMTKYRQQTASLIKLHKTDLTSLHNTKYNNIISNQAEKINEMAAVMKTAASMDEERELKAKELLYRLNEENKVLREVVNIGNKYGSMGKENPPIEDKIVQTE